MTYFKRTIELTEEERRQVSEQTAKIHKGILEGRSIIDISEQLHLSPKETLQNIDELLYELRRLVGRKRYFKQLFRK